MAKYCSLFSGSSGNCTYLASSQGGLLVDAGVSAKRIKEALTGRGIDPASVRGIFLTHEHKDHISGLRVFTKQFPMPIYATAGTAQALIDQGALPPDADLRVIGDEAVEVAGTQVQAFETPHDSAQSCGFRLTFPDGRCAAVATDIGMMTPTILEALKGAHLVHIESNHDVGMLQCGPYPYMLKCRVLGRGGHLSNDACADTLPTLLESGSTRFMLAHLSRENNLPELAYQTSAVALARVGATIGSDCLLNVAAPENKQGLVYF